MRSLWTRAVRWTFNLMDLYQTTKTALAWVNRGGILACRGVEWAQVLWSA
jgi:hypothetical protein